MAQSHGWHTPLWDRDLGNVLLSIASRSGDSVLPCAQPMPPQAGHLRPVRAAPVLYHGDIEQGMADSAVTPVEGHGRVEPDPGVARVDVAVEEDLGQAALVEFGHALTHVSSSRRRPIRWGARAATLSSSKVAR